MKDAASWGSNRCSSIVLFGAALWIALLIVGSVMLP